MKKYVKDNVVINATEKAFNVLYKAQGYTEYKEEKKNTKKKEEADK